MSGDKRRTATAKAAVLVSDGMESPVGDQTIRADFMGAWSAHDQNQTQRKAVA